MIYYLLRLFLLIDHKCACDIFWYIYKNRTFSALVCNIESFSDNVSKLRRVFHNVVMLCDRHCYPADIYLLKRVKAKQISCYISCDSHHRDRIHISCGDTCYKVRSTWT